MTDSADKRAQDAKTLADKKRCPCCSQEWSGGAGGKLGLHSEGVGRDQPVHQHSALECDWLIKCYGYAPGGIAGTGVAVVQAATCEA